MKALRYLLIAAMIVLAGAWSVANAVPQGIAKEPQIDMHSTSVMVGSGSHLPQAAIEGTTTTEDSNTSGFSKGGPRRALDDDDPDIGSGTIGQPFPIGDAALPLALLACAYLIIRVARRRVKGDRTA